MRLACGDCDRVDGDGIVGVPPGWRDVGEALSSDVGCWWTHLGTCPECDVRANGLEFVVPGNAVPQPRYGKSPGGKHYLPADAAVHAYKEACAFLAKTQYKGPPLDGVPLVLRIKCIFERPRRLLRPSSPAERLPYFCKNRNDWDNLGKATCDALNKVWFADDGLVFRGTVERWYRALAETPHVRVSLDIWKGEQE